jgi:hypothetical protein
MMFCSIVGQASFHTAGASGPSMIDRSKRVRRGGAGGGSGSATVAFIGSAAASSSAGWLMVGSIPPI